jgi:hypothetical protein
MILVILSIPVILIPRQYCKTDSNVSQTLQMKEEYVALQSRFSWGIAMSRHGLPLHAQQAATTETASWPFLGVPALRAGGLQPSYYPQRFQWPYGPYGFVAF